MSAKLCFNYCITSRKSAPNISTTPSTAGQTGKLNHSSPNCENFHKRNAPNDAGKNGVGSYRRDLIGIRRAYVRKLRPSKQINGISGFSEETFGYSLTSFGYPETSNGYSKSYNGYPKSYNGYPEAFIGYPLASAGYPLEDFGYPKVH